MVRIEDDNDGNSYDAVRNLLEEVTHIERVKDTRGSACLHCP